MANNEPWFVTRWAFRRLLERTALHVTLADDRHLIQQAIALDGLLFDLLDNIQARRLARALQVAASEVKAELRTERDTGASTDPRDEEFIVALAVLEQSLGDLRE